MIWYRPIIVRYKTAFRGKRIITSYFSSLSCQFQVDPGKHNMLEGGFYNKCAVIVHFELQNWGKKYLFACRPTCEIQKD